MQVQVSNPNTSNQDSTIGNLLGGRSLEALIAELHGKYYQQTYRGNMFSAATAAAGVLIPVESTTAPTFGIWNPAGSGYNAVMVAATYGFVSTTAAPGNIGLTVKKGAGSAIATAAPISTFNAAAAGVVQNMLLGGGNASRMNVTIAGTNALTSAGTILGTSGMSALTTTGATTTVPMWTLREDFDGTVIIPPGNFLYPTSSSTANLTIYDIRWIWYEFPA